MKISHDDYLKWESVCPFCGTEGYCAVSCELSEDIKNTDMYCEACEREWSLRSWTRVLGWMTIDYEIRLHRRQPTMTVSNTGKLEVYFMEECDDGMEFQRGFWHRLMDMSRVWLTKFSLFSSKRRRVSLYDM